MAYLSESLTKKRPIAYVRNMQFILVCITLAFVTYALAIPFFGQKSIDLNKWKEGKIAETTVIASKEILFDDLEKTKLEKQKSADRAPLVFIKDASVLKNLILPTLAKDLELLASFKSEEQVRSNFPKWSGRSREELENFLKISKTQKYNKSISQFVTVVYSNFCIVKEVPKELLNAKNQEVKILDTTVLQNQTSVESKYIISRKDLYISEKENKLLYDISKREVSFNDSDLEKSFFRLGFYYLYSYTGCSFEESLTAEGKKLAFEETEKVKGKIALGETIVQSGEVVTKETVFKLGLLNQYATRANIASIVSILIIQIILVTIIAYFLRKYRPKRLEDLSSNFIVFSMIWILVFSSILSSKIFFANQEKLDTIFYFALFTPIAFVSLFIAFVYDTEIAIAVGFYLCIFLFFAGDNNSTSFILSLVSTIAASIFAKKIQKRADFLKAGFLITGILILISFAGYLYDGREFFSQNASKGFWENFISSNFTKLVFLCILNGFGSSFGVQIALPIYEYIFNIPTKFKLIELADTGHPLLQSLLTKAPSTYTHTFLVAALSERAAQNLNLDVQLVRVGVYFHDIGKTVNAGFFAENQHLIPKPENIDKDDPSKAAKVIIDHVLDGIEMAKKARLPREIINFIPEHHGTSTMAFFYHKALLELPKKSKRFINKKDFQYPGPKPQSKETAIVMIADSLEAASRTLEDISYESLNALIQRIINSKLAENQLDESGLTFGDLEIIKKSFCDVLLSSLHNRPKYPSTEDTKKLETKKLENRKLKTTKFSKRT